MIERRLSNRKFGKQKATEILTTNANNEQVSLRILAQRDGAIPDFFNHLKEIRYLPEN